jgi:glycosyltransferase involved in cell wall biosynthesis
MEVATICSAVGANCEVISHGDNGFLATTGEEWIDSFDRLIGDSQLRERLGREGRRTVEERYSMIRCGSMMERVIRETVERPELAPDYDLSSEEMTPGR